MSLILAALSSIITASGLSILLGWYQLRKARAGDYDAIKNGCWTTSRRGEGSREALRVHRVKIAKWAGFGMNRSEAIYWGASHDSTGDRITFNHKYKIEGRDPEARWWCLTVNRDGFFIPNEQKRYSFSKTDVQREADGSWVIKLSTELQAGNWVPLGNQEGDIRITLRCYNPAASMRENGENIELPRIIREN